MRLVDGREFDVRHPEHLAVSTRHVLFIDNPDEAITWIEPHFVVTLDFQNAEEAKPSNGKPRGNAGPDLQSLLSLFPSAAYFQGWKLVLGDQVPEPYRHLLVHEHHMTVTVEAHHGSLVDVRILDLKQDETSYARKILLALRSSSKIVQFGIMRIRLEFCSLPVRDAILAGQTPLGRILINHGVLRRIEPTAFLRITPGQDLMTWFGLAEPTPTYGRLAYIHCDGKPAIELLEIVAPEYNTLP
jgi:chorismate-pyruvate lyase